MNSLIGIRREDKNRWERRAPLVPEHTGELIGEHSVGVIVQTSDIRVFAEEEYLRSGAAVKDDLSACPVIFAIKEIPPDLFQPKKTYCFFSHTVKGQSYNMPMLKRMLDLKCQLIDYEKVVDESGRRLLFFGRHAGIAGMIDTLWALGKRLEYEGIDSPFLDIRQTHRYASLAEAKAEISRVGETIRADGLAESLTPLVCGVAGYGNVSRGVQEILDLLPVAELSPGDIASLFGSPKADRSVIHKVVFREEDTVEPISAAEGFELQDYYEHPERYKSRFHTYLPHLTLLVNCIYWEARYPRLVGKEDLKHLCGGDDAARLRVIGDVSADVEGAIECTLRHTDPDNPVFVYDPSEDQATDGWEGVGVVVLAVDNLPCEIARESSTDFSESLKGFVPEIAGADFSVDFSECKLSPAIKDAVIVHHGELTPPYRYLEKFM